MRSLADVRAIVERHFRVYDAREEKVRGEVAAHLFFVMFPPSEFDARYEAVRAELARADPETLCFLRREGGEDVLFVARRPPPSPRRLATHVVLFLLTVLTLTSAGTYFFAGFHADGPLASRDVLRPANVLGGFLTFAVPVLLVLGIHEMGHYIVARRHGLRPTLPFFIPFPSFGGLSLGTLGAFIAMRDPMPDRKTLFDVGASGPIAGFLVAVPLVLAGAWMTQSAGHEAPDLHRPEVDLPTGVVEAAGRGRAELRLDDGTRHLLAVTAPQENTGRIDYTLRLTYGLPGGVRGEDVSVLRLEPGRTAHRLLQVPGNATGAQASLEWDDGLRGFGDPLLVRSFRWFGLESDGLLSHPTYIAGWVGLLVTGINLLPVSQLDGGHVARAVLGERMKYAAFGAITLLLVLTYLFRTWLILALFIVLMGIHHPPPLNDRTPLDRKRLALAVVVLLILVLTFVPVPFQM